MKKTPGVKLLIAWLAFLANPGIAQQITGTQEHTNLSYRRILDGTDVPNAVSVVSPDGQRLAFIQNGDLFVRDLSTGVVRGITTLDADNRASFGAVWSADSTRLAISTANRTSLVILNADGSNLRKLYQAPAGTGVFPRSWSRDGTRLLVWMQSSPNTRLAWFSIADSVLHEIPSRATPDFNPIVST